MHKQTLKNLLRFHIAVTFEEFCREVFPDFKCDESRGYLICKFDQFQKRFFPFLAELDEAHLEYLADAIRKRYGSDDPEYCDIVEKAEKLIARSQIKGLSEAEQETMMQDAENLLAAELYPFESRLDTEEREMEFAVIHDLIDRIEPVSRGEF